MIWPVVSTCPTNTIGTPIRNRLPITTTKLCGSTYVMLFTTMVVTLLVMLIVSIVPVMLTTVPLGSGVAVGMTVGAGVIVGVCVIASTVMLWASNAPTAVMTPWTCALAPRVGVPLIVVCES